MRTSFTRPFGVLLILALAVLAVLAPRPARAQSASDLDALIKQMSATVTQAQKTAESLQRVADSLAKAGVSKAPSAVVNGAQLTAEQARQLAAATAAVRKALQDALASAPKAATCQQPDPAKAAETQARYDALKALPGTDPRVLTALSRLKALFTNGARGCRMG